MLVALSAVASTGCVRAVGTTQTPVAEAYAFRTVDAAEIAGYARDADAVADARLDAVRYEAGPDGMHGTMLWTAVRCHVGDCATGQTFRTRFSAAFYTTGPFCNARQGCAVSGALTDQVGKLFLATFTRAPYEAQTSGQGVPQAGITSLNRGYYLIHDGALLHNDAHYRIDARHEAVVSRLSGDDG